MSNASISHTTVNMGVSDAAAEAALTLAKAALANAKAIREIALALNPPNASTGVYVGGDIHQIAPAPAVWRGEGFYPADETA